MRKCFFVAITAACMAALPACSASGGYVISQLDVGNVTGTGSTLVAEFDSSPSMGYDWSCTFSSDIAEISEDRFDAGDSSGGTQTYVINFSGAGETIITFEYGSLSGDAPTKVATVTVTTDDNGDIRTMYAEETDGGDN